MPTTLGNALLGAWPDRSWTVRGPDRLTAVVPMYEEEAGAGRALTSLLTQRVPVAAVVVSVNGGRDRTPQVVATTLCALGYERVEHGTWGPAASDLTRWAGPTGAPEVAVVAHPVPVSKADSLNLAVEGGLVKTERVLVMDGDTVLDPGFVAAIRDGFYRLRREGSRDAPRWVLDSVAVQSGSATSALPQRRGGAARFISLARAAEYAFALVVRRGQAALLGRGPTFGRSRLFTVVGCGFAARRDTFPLPSDTRTEDHDFTMAVQAGEVTGRASDAATLHLRGFRVVVDGRERPLADLVENAPVHLRHTADARFEAGAAMATEDPPAFGPYLHQVERWVGGALEVVLKRVRSTPDRRALAPNVRFALLTAQLENLAGLLLLLAFPAVLGLAWPRVEVDALARTALLWVFADLLVTGSLVGVGFWTQARALGQRRAAAARRALGGAVLGVLPLLVLRPLNVLAYATALFQVAAHALAARRAGTHTRVDTIWQRPAQVRAGVRWRSLAVASGLTSIASIGFAIAMLPWWFADPGTRDAVRVLREAPPIALEDVTALPLAAPLRPVPLVTPEVAIVGSGTPSVPPAAEPVAVLAVERCDPAASAAAALTPRYLTRPEAAYAPLGAWATMTLARLVPVLPAVERAATAYDVPAVWVLQVLLNESYLDPLARGQTGDVGLAQMTADALTLLRALAEDPASPFANPNLFAGTVNVFDPAFSVCAGAAKLAWALSQPGERDLELAYARYINPIDGVVAGRVSDRHRPLVDAFVRVGGMADTLAATVDAYRADPASVAPLERSLLAVSGAVADGTLSIEDAYRRVATLVDAAGVDDVAFYRAVLSELYGPPAAPAESEDLAHAPSR